MPLSSTAEVTMAAADMTFAGHLLARLETFHTFADRFNHSHELVPDNERRMDAALRPFIPLVNVKIGAADPRLLNPDQHLAAPADGAIDRFEIHARSAGFFHESRHFGHHVFTKVMVQQLR